VWPRERIEENVLLITLNSRILFNERRGRSDGKRGSIRTKILKDLLISSGKTLHFQTSGWKVNTSVHVVSDDSLGGYRGIEDARQHGDVKLLGASVVTHENPTFDIQQIRVRLKFTLRPRQPSTRECLGYVGWLCGALGQVIKG